MKTLSEKPVTHGSFPSPFISIPIEILVSVGQISPLLCEVLDLVENDVLLLNKTIEDSVDLFVGNRLVARGQLEELEGDQPGQLSVRLIEIVTT